MAEIVYPHEGQNHLLNILFGSTAVYATTWLCLYKNDITPSVGSTNASFTQSDFTGYAAKSLSRGSWTITQGTALNNTYCTYAEQTFTCTLTPSPDQYAYGYYIIIGAISTWYVYAAQRFDVTQKITTASNIKIIPKIVIGDYTAYFRKDFLALQEALSHS